jgi:hypothetical protein
MRVRKVPVIHSVLARIGVFALTLVAAVPVGVLAALAVIAGGVVMLLGLDTIPPSWMRDGGVNEPEPVDRRADPPPPPPRPR